jgi:hypothetical protein
MERTKDDGLFLGVPYATILDLPDIGNGGVVHTWPELLERHAYRDYVLFQFLGMPIPPKGIGRRDLR